MIFVPSSCGPHDVVPPSIVGGGACVTLPHLAEEHHTVHCSALHTRPGEEAAASKSPFPTHFPTRHTAYCTLHTNVYFTIVFVLQLYLYNKCICITTVFVLKPYLYKNCICITTVVILQLCLHFNCICTVFEIPPTSRHRRIHATLRPHVSLPFWVIIATF